MEVIWNTMKINSETRKLMNFFKIQHKKTITTTKIFRKSKVVALKEHI